MMAFQAMMNETRLKYIFFISAALLLCLMMIMSRDAGISCDEILHYNHSLAVVDYFESDGLDKKALDTPVSHLKYYGQSYDNLVTTLAKWLDIEDVYGFRHLMSSVAGWLAVLVTALFATWLSGYMTGIVVLVFFAVTPSFIGHSLNNLKDIPFALGYIASIFFTTRIILSEKKIAVSDILFLTVSIAFSISIRAGGLLLICYLYFFFFAYCLIRYITERNFDLKVIRIKLIYITGISIAGWILGILFWPYALQEPVKNVLDSYKVMAHYPDTFRQIFEGKVEWSDFMPWYYLPKSMIITIPLIVLSGLLFFSIFIKKAFIGNTLYAYGFLIFSIIFPVVFVIYQKSNLYSSWRQFLFLYPAIVLLSAAGFKFLFEKINRKYFVWSAIILFTILSIHPVRFMIRNHPYHYIYYNQLVGGLEGAYSKYETDYYYVSQTEASHWLIDYLKESKLTVNLKVKATYSVQWLFRNHPEIETSWFRYEERSQSDWDYAIVVNRYIHPYQLVNKIWPPENSIHTIYVENVPVCAVLERKTKDDYKGYNALTEGKITEAIKYFASALRVDDNDELIFYNFAAALYKDGQFQKADSLLKKGLEKNPAFEPILMYLGNIDAVQNKTDEAVNYYERLIRANRKYFEAYVELSKLMMNKDIQKARILLRTCLKMNPGFRPAIIALADSYRISNPEIARKYDELAKRLN